MNDIPEEVYKKTAHGAFENLRNELVSAWDEFRIALAPQWYRDDKDRLNKCVIEQKKLIDELTKK